MNPFSSDLLLHLNHYQAANLRWLLALVHDGHAVVDTPTKPRLDTGDWCGELRWALEQEMIEHDVPNTPNLDHGHNPKLAGTCCGQKKDNFELSQLRLRVERIQKVADLAEVELGERLRMIEELAMGYVDLRTIKKIEGK